MAVNVRMLDRADSLLLALGILQLPALALAKECRLLAAVDEPLYRSGPEEEEVVEVKEEVEEEVEVKEEVKEEVEEEVEEEVRPVEEVEGGVCAGITEGT